MKKIYLVSTLVSLSCSSPEKSKVKSQWVDLKSVAGATCTPWPLAEQDLEVQAILPVEGSGKLVGAVSTVKRRNASLAHSYWQTGEKVSVDVEKSIQLPMSQNTVVVGAWAVGTLPIVVTAINSGGRSTLEARSVKDNRVIARSQFVLEGNVRDSDFSIDGSDMWMSLRTGDYSTVFAKLTVKGKTGQFEKVGSPSESRGAIIVVDREKHSPFLVENQPHSDRILLKVTPIKSKDFSFGPSQQIQMEVKGRVESWAVSSGLGGFFLAAVTGDSMVGQSQMFIALVESKDSLITWGWQKTIPMPDIHVSEPVWAAANGGSEVTIMKWLEGEATMGVFSASKSGMEARKDRGIYPKGSIVLSAFQPKEGKLGAVVRQRRDDLWIYSICNSDL